MKCFGEIRVVLAMLMFLPLYKKVTALEVTSVKSPHKYFCGAYGLQVVFTPSRQQRGFVVQKFSRNENVINCSDGQRHSNSITYYEAWPIPVNQVSQPYLSDIWQGPENSATRGEILIEAEVGEFSVEKLPEDMVQYHPQTNAGALYSSLKKPSFWLPSNSGAKRQARITWDCCPALLSKSQIQTRGFSRQFVGK